jgi:hypothetical protein
VAIPQGDLKLLDSVAKRLLNSAIPARIANIAKDGTPRVIPTWFHWNGNEVVMATFIAGPSASPTGPPRSLRANPNVAITIDTEVSVACASDPRASLGDRGRRSRNLKERQIAILERTGQGLPQSDEQSRRKNGADRCPANLGRHPPSQGSIPEFADLLDQDQPQPRPADGGWGAV